MIRAALLPLLLAATIEAQAQTASPPPAPVQAPPAACTWHTAAATTVGVAVDPPGAWIHMWCDDGFGWRSHLYAANWSEMQANAIAALMADSAALARKPQSEAAAALGAMLAKHSKHDPRTHMPLIRVWLPGIDKIEASKPPPIVWRPAPNGALPDRPARLLKQGVLTTTSERVQIAGTTCACALADMRVRTTAGTWCAVAGRPQRADGSWLATTCTRSQP